MLPSCVPHLSALPAPSSEGVLYFAQNRSAIWMIPALGALHPTVSFASPVRHRGQWQSHHGAERCHVPRGAPVAWSALQNVAQVGEPWRGVGPALTLIDLMWL